MSSSTTDTLGRQWELLRLIPRAPRRTTVKELRTELAHRGYPTTARTIERDLQALSGRFGLVSDETSKPYGWSWAKDANFQFTPRLSASQGVALLLSQAHLRGFLPHTLLGELAPVFDLAAQEVASTGWKDWHRRTAVIPASLPLLAPDMSPGVLDHVHSALALKRCLTGRYRSRGSQATKEMKIHPLGLLVRGAVQYLVCTLRNYRDVRHIALHRLSHTAILDEPCVAPDDFDFARHVASDASKYRAQGMIRLVARLTAQTAEHLRDTPISSDQVIDEATTDGYVELTATIECDETLRWWLLGFGSKVEVIEPAGLRDELREELLAATRRYGVA